AAALPAVQSTTQPVAAAPAAESTRQSAAAVPAAEPNQPSLAAPATAPVPAALPDSTAPTHSASSSHSVAAAPTLQPSRAPRSSGPDRDIESSIESRSDSVHDSSNDSRNDSSGGPDVAAASEPAPAQTVSPARPLEAADAPDAYAHDVPAWEDIPPDLDAGQFEPFETMGDPDDPEIYGLSDDDTALGHEPVAA